MKHNNNNNKPRATYFAVALTGLCNSKKVRKLVAEVVVDPYFAETYPKNTVGMVIFLQLLLFRLNSHDREPNEEKILQRCHENVELKGFY